jgi:hypothetical protein
LRSIAQSRAEPASRVERARILLVYREDPSFFAVGRALGLHSSDRPGRDDLQRTDVVLSRPHYGRRAVAADGSDVVLDVTGRRHGRRVHTLTGTFGKTGIAVPRARLNTAEGRTTEWKSRSPRAYQRRTLAADALIAGAYLAGTNTRRV